MSRNWQLARDWIVRSIDTEALRPGDRIPAEPELLREIGVGRHSLRRAIASLAAAGVLIVQQGRGTFVRSQPRLQYRIGRRTRYRANLAAQGVTPGGDAISTDLVPCEPEVARALALAPGTPVHRVLRRGRADATPISLTRSFHPAGRFPGLGEARMAGVSVTEVYARHGIPDYLRRDTTLFARLPEKWEARLLEQPADQPVIVMCKLDVDLEGRPIGWSEAVWAAGRVHFHLDLQD